MKLDPLSGLLHGDLAYSFWVGRQYEEAITRYTRALELDPKLDASLRHRSMAHAFRGDFNKARADIARALELQPDSLWNITVEGFHEDHLRRNRTARCGLVWAGCGPSFAREAGTGCIHARNDGRRPCARDGRR